MNAYFGNIQVQAIVSGGKLTSVNVLGLSERSRHLGAHQHRRDPEIGTGGHHLPERTGRHRFRRDADQRSVSTVACYRARESKELKAEVEPRIEVRPQPTTMLQETLIIMGMPVTVAIADADAERKQLNTIFEYFRTIDARFSPFKETSETSAVNRSLARENWSDEMRTVVALAEKTKQETRGYFDIDDARRKIQSRRHRERLGDKERGGHLARTGFRNFYIDAGGDIEASGMNDRGEKWSVGIKNPFKQDEIVKTIFLTDLGVATSGTYIRGDHIYDPHTGKTENTW